MPLELQFFGKPRIEDEQGTEVKLKTRRAYWILAHLWLHRGLAIDRGVLASYFWPDKNSIKGKGSLKTELSALNKHLNSYGLLSLTATTALFNPDVNVCVDVEHFEAAIETGKRERGWAAMEALKRAIELYQGRFLEDCNLEWVLLDQSRLENHRVEALESLICLSGQVRNYPLVVDYASQILSAYPHREDIHRQLIFSLYAQGKKDEALAQIDESVKIIKKEHRSPPDEKSKAFIGKIKKGAPQSELAEFIGCLGHEKPTNLPALREKIIGREREIEAVIKLIQAHDLVMILGTGGTGKTRLANEIGWRLLDQFEHGVWIIDVVNIQEEALLAQAIGRPFGLREQSGQKMIDVLADFLREKEILLILDECERWNSACAKIATQLFKSAPNLKILATSREEFNIPGEHVWQNPTLPTPDLDDDSSTDDLMTFPSIELFERRAREKHDLFMLSEKNKHHVVSICHQLNGIPLGIELAAALVDSLPLKEIDEDLENLIDLSDDYEKTLESAIAWSYGHLSELEQKLFVRISVFTGGFTIQAAKDVCVCNGLELADLLQALSSLVKKSLLIYETTFGTESSVDEPARYRQLEMIRSYGKKRLLESCETEHWHMRHLEFYLALAIDKEPDLTSSKQKEALEDLESEHNNFNAALDRSLECEWNELGLRLAGALWLYWYIRGFWKEGRYWLESLLDQTDSIQDRSAIAKGLYAAAAIAHNQGNLDVAEGYALKSLEIAEEIGDQKAQADVLNIMGTIFTKAGKHNYAEEFYKGSLEICRSIEDEAGEGAALISSGFFYFEIAEFEKSITCTQDALEIYRETDDQVCISKCLVNLGGSYLGLCDYQLALTNYEDVLPILDSVGDANAKADALDNLGAIYKGIAMEQHPALVCNSHIKTDLLGKASKLHLESLILNKQIGRRFGEAKALRNIALGEFCATHFREALATATRSHDLALELDYEWILVSSKTILAKSHFHLGNFDAALEYSSAAAKIIENNISHWTDETRFAHYFVLSELGEKARAFPYLEMAYHMTISRSEKINDSDLQQKFLAARSSIIEAWEREIGAQRND